MECKKALQSLCSCNVPSGRENWIYKCIDGMFNKYDVDISMDNLNNITILKKGKSKRKIMLMAHIDEVFLMITSICHNGLIKFKGNGVDLKTLIGQEVTIHSKQKVQGIVGCKSNEINENNLFIDTGVKKELLLNIVKVGDYVTINRQFYELFNNKVTSKAVDNRAGVVALYECFKELCNVSHDLNVYFVCSAQEEVGHRGAKVASYNIKPDMAIAVDVTFDSGRFGDDTRKNILGYGPVICIGPNIHTGLRKNIVKLAKEYNIPYQIEVEPGNTGTDAWDIQTSNEGIPTLLISIPIKYMHTSVEVINIDDIKSTGRLMAKFIESLNDIEMEEIVCF